VPTVGSLAWSLIADNTRFAAGTAAARRNLRGLHTDLVSLKGALTGVAGAAGFAAITTGILGAGTAAAAFVKEGVRMSASLEQLRVNLDVMTGSAETGKALLGEMVTLAKETPFSLEDVASSGKVLLAMGTAAGDVTRRVKMLGDVAAGTSQPVAELAQVFGEVQNAGRLMSNELRQFNMRGIPLLSELSEMLGATKLEIRGMIEAGEITADMVEKAFERMTSAGGRFADLMGKQAETLTGKWEKFKDALSLSAAGAAGEAGTTGTLSNFLSNALDEASKALTNASSGAELFQSQGAAGFTQAGQMRFAMEKINKMAADAVALKNAQAKPTMEPNAAELEAMANQEKLNAKMAEWVDGLQLQIDTYGMASDAAKLYEMRMRGATKADLEAAQALIDQKTKLEEDKRMTEETDKANADRAMKQKELFDSLATPAQKFIDEFVMIKDLLGPEGFVNPDLFGRAMEDLRSRVEAAIGMEGPAATQSTAAIRAGSIDALRAQFSGNIPQKQLKEAEKQTREQESMRGLLEDIRDKLNPLAEAPG